MMVTVQKLTLSSPEEAPSDTSSPASSAALKSLSCCNCSWSLSTYQDRVYSQPGQYFWMEVDSTITIQLKANINILRIANAEIYG